MTSKLELHRLNTSTKWVSGVPRVDILTVSLFFSVSLDRQSYIVYFGNNLNVKTEEKIIDHFSATNAIRSYFICLPKQKHHIDLFYQLSMANLWKQSCVLDNMLNRLS